MSWSGRVFLERMFSAFAVNIPFERTGAEREMNTPLQEMILNRTDFTDKSTIGDLFFDGELYCYILERTCRKTDTIVAIPQGKYEVVMYESPRLKMRVPLLLKVPGRDMIEIHAGNKPEDSIGCLLPGLSKSVDYVMDSRKALAGLIEKIEEKLKAGKFYIGITGGGA